MTLAAILGMYALLATGSSGSIHVSPLPFAQEAPPQQEAPQTSPAPPPSEPQTNPQEEPSQPPQESKPDQPDAASPAPSPDSTQQKEAAPPQTTEEKKSSKPSPAKKSVKRRKKPAPPAQPPAGDTPTKTVIRNGSTVDPGVQISTGGTEEQVSRQKKSTTQLLQRTEANLRKISVRQLDAGQQDTVKQIRMYLGQAKAAVDSGDLQRAHNLAFKANLLSAELLQH